MTASRQLCSLLWPGRRGRSQVSVVSYTANKGYYLYRFYSDVEAVVNNTCAVSYPTHMVVVYSGNSAGSKTQKVGGDVVEVVQGPRKRTTCWANSLTAIWPIGVLSSQITTCIYGRLVREVPGIAAWTIPLCRPACMPPYQIGNRQGEGLRIAPSIFSSSAVWAA